MLTQTINNNASEKKLSSNPQEISKIFFLIPDDWTVKYSGYSNSTFQEFPDKANCSDPVLLETNHSEIVPNRAKDSHRPADRPAGHETSLLGTSE